MRRLLRAADLGGNLRSGRSLRPPRQQARPAQGRSLRRARGGQALAHGRAAHARIPAQAAVPPGRPRRRAGALRARPDGVDREDPRADGAPLRRRRQLGSRSREDASGRAGGRAAARSGAGPTRVGQGRGGVPARLARSRAAARAGHQLARLSSRRGAGEELRRALRRRAAGEAGSQSAREPDPASRVRAGTGAAPAFPRRAALGQLHAGGNRQQCAHSADADVWSFVASANFLSAAGRSAESRIGSAHADAAAREDAGAGGAGRFAGVRSLAGRAEAGDAHERSAPRARAEGPRSGARAVREGRFLPARAPRRREDVHLRAYRIRAGPFDLLDRGGPTGAGRREGASPMKRLAFALLLCAACNKEAKPEERAPAGEALLSRQQLDSLHITTAQVAEREVGGELVTSGRVAFDDLRVAHIFSPVTGRVTSIRAQLGQRVQKGAPLAGLQSPDLGSALADVNKAQADLIAAEHELKRQKELFEAHARAQRDLEQAEDNERKARAELNRSRAKARLLSSGSVDAVTQEYVLRSPIAGEVIARNANPGAEVQGQYSAGAPQG